VTCGLETEWEYSGRMGMVGTAKKQDDASKEGKQKKSKRY